MMWLSSLCEAVFQGDAHRKGHFGKRQAYCTTCPAGCHDGTLLSAVLTPSAYWLSSNEALVAALVCCKTRTGK